MRRLNPLHSVEFLAHMMRDTGCYPDPDRCTGRSTALGLTFIAKAINNPNEWIEIQDHASAPNANVFLMHTIQKQVAVLGLDHFKFKPKYIKFGG